MNNTEIGECMKQLRENAGLSAKDVSRLLFDKYGIEMNHRTLFNYEKGRSSPDLVRFLALCHQKMATLQIDWRGKRVE